MQNISVFALNINDIKKKEQEALSLLTNERKLKALRYRFDEDRLRCIGAGLLLRKYCNITSDEQITVNEYGKPFASDVHFNISHSGEWVLLCTANFPVGIDIEYIKPPKQKAAEYAFCDDELFWLSQNPNKDFGFYTLWTQKEAVTKAIGKGLRLSPKSFCVLPLEQKLTVDGQQVYCKTKQFGNYVVSVAAFSPFDDFSIIIGNNII